MSCCARSAEDEAEWLVAILRGMRGSVCWGLEGLRWLGKLRRLLFSLFSLQSLSLFSLSARLYLWIKERER